MPASTTTSEVSRSPLLLDRRRSALLVVDVQEKLLPVVRNAERTVAKIGVLLEAARIFEIPVFVGEQYPRGLGHTVTSLAEKLSGATIIEKIDFSCPGNADFREKLSAGSRRQIVVVGIETHVCVQQTALDLASLGYQVFVVADAVTAALTLDHEIALARMSAAGIIVVTTEAVLFEWCERAGTAEFKSLSALVKSLRAGDTSTHANATKEPT